MSIRKQNKGVSPVIGVILMVAITVIIAAVVANFVLDLAGNLEQEADATVIMNQEVSQFGADRPYNVSVVVSQMDNADYLIIKEQTEGAEVNSIYSGPEPSGVDYAPDSSADAGATGTEAANSSILVSPGDEAVVWNVSAGSTIQIYGALDGSENLITTYEVQNTLG